MERSVPTTPDKVSAWETEMHKGSRMLSRLTLRPRHNNFVLPSTTPRCPWSNLFLLVPRAGTRVRSQLRIAQEQESSHCAPRTFRTCAHALWMVLGPRGNQKKDGRPCSLRVPNPTLILPILLRSTPEPCCVRHSPFAKHIIQYEADLRFAVANQPCTRASLPPVRWL